MPLAKARSRSAAGFVGKEASTSRRRALRWLKRPRSRSEAAFAARGIERESPEKFAPSGFEDAPGLPLCSERSLQASGRRHRPSTSSCAPRRDDRTRLQWFSIGLEDPPVPRDQRRLAPQSNPHCTPQAANPSQALQDRIVNNSKPDAAPSALHRSPRLQPASRRRRKVRVHGHPLADYAAP